MAAMPLALAVRGILRTLGAWVSRSLARFVASWLPIAVPGYSPGAEPLDRGTVAVIGGGIAGCGAAWMLAESGAFEVTLFEARASTSGNARTFDWDGFSGSDDKEKMLGNVEAKPGIVKSCVSVTAWPPLLYKNYTALLGQLGVETCPMPLSWFVYSKVPGLEGSLWAASSDDSATYGGVPSLRKVFARDFALYASVETFARRTTDLFTLAWAPWKRGDTQSMYTNHTGLGMLNPLNIFPLYDLCKLAGISDEWWDIVFTPHYTASFLVDELRPFPAVFAPIIEAQIPLLPLESNSWKGPSSRSADDCNLTTCVTWKDAGTGIRAVFKRLVEKVDLRTDCRVISVELLANGKKRIVDEHDQVLEVDRVIFACPCNAVGNIFKQHSPVADAVLNVPVYADDHHPAAGHMHAVMHSDPSVIDARVREEFLRRGSNYVEVTRLASGEINIENQYNFGVQTPGPGVYDLPLDKKPVMLISHALGEGKAIDPSTIRGGGNHARAHPLYSGWNVMAQLALRLAQGQHGVYYCSNWTTPGNCHDMSLLSGMLCAHACGAPYPFKDEPEAKKDFYRLNDLMGIF